MRVLVAMSGGVDSSVAAARMVAEGHDVIGVTLKLWAGPNGEMPTAGCCTVSDSEDARRVASQLDIPYYVLDYTEDFSRGVIDGFVTDYLSGRTPNPCVECNRTVKFSRLLSQASEFDCDLVATGHYARVDFHEGRFRLRRGVDAAKDQSYVLSMLGQQQLSMVRFPVGDVDKPEVRRIASELGLRTAAKPESMDICFVGRRDYRSFLRSHAPEAVQPGAVVTTYALGDGQLYVAESDQLVVEARGADLADIRAYVLSRPEVPPSLARQLLAIDDWTATLPVPVPVDSDAWRETTVGGHPGLVIEDAVGAGVLWHDGERIHAVGGVGVEVDEVTRIADSVGG